VPDDAAAPAPGLSEEETQRLSEAAFDPERLLEVRIEIDEADFSTLKGEGRQIADLFADLACPEGPSLYEYTWFEATATIGGERVERIGVRKKGFLGSLSAVRPSLKLKFDRFVPGQHYSGLERMTLNNNRQDPSNVHQCLTYDLFADAGLPAPRCSYAHVFVNGEDLGIYTHVESIKKAFLRRHFEDDSGNLYEGQSADFLTGLTKIFEWKTNLATNDGSDLEAVVTALEAPDDRVVDEIGALIDLDRFVDVWILESMTAHWDSYSGNANNYYAYHDPVSDQFHFIPWGADGAFELDRGGATASVPPASVQAKGAIANRLYSLPSFRERYVERQRELLDSVWDESALLAEIDRVSELVQPVAEVDEDAIAEVRGVVEGRRAAIEAEIASGPLDTTFSTRSVGCADVAPTPIGATFSTSWSDLSGGGGVGAAPGSSGTLDVALPGGPGPLTVVGADAGLSADLGRPSPSIRLIATDEAGQVYALLLVVAEELYGARREVPLHGVETVGILVQVGGTGTPRPLGMVSKGAIVFDEAGAALGEAVVGSLQGTFTLGTPGG
jgi:spore coat protein CotH